MAEGRHRPDDIAYVTALVRAEDRPRYYSALFAPAERRGDLWALYGFAAEIARIPDLVKEPPLGEIRLKWWQEALPSALHAPEAAETPTLRALAATIAAHALPLAAFDALLEASAFDLYSDPPATAVDLEGRLGETQSALFQMAAIILGASSADTAETAGHAGIAYGLARRLATFGAARARGRSILPAEFLAAQGLSPEEVFADKPGPALSKAVAEAARHGRAHLDKALAAYARLPRQARPAFLPLAVVAPLLDRVLRLGPAVVHANARLSDLSSLSRIGWAHLRSL